MPYSNKDEDHDKNWRNFIDAAKIKFGMIRDYCNEEVYDRFGGVVVGFNGRVDYAPFAKGHHPIGGTTVSKETKVDVTLLV